MATIPDTFKMALQHLKAGEWTAAEERCRQILACDPRHTDALYLLGGIALQRGQNAGAIEYISKAIALNGSVAEFHNDLGVAYRASGQFDQAVAQYRQALALKPAYTEAHYNLGQALLDQGQMEAAAACFRHAVALRPGFAEAFNLLGSTLSILGNTEEAVASYRQGLALKPAFAEAFYNLGNALMSLGRLEEAAASYQQALAIKPDLAEALLNLGNIRQAQGFVEEASMSHQRALMCRPYDAALHANVLFSMSYNATTPDLIAREYKKWSDRHVRSFAVRSGAHANDRNPERRLRVGYVSADFCGHPVTCFIEPLLAGHDRARMEVFAYSNTSRADATTKRLRAVFDVWRNIDCLSDEAVADLVRRDGIDTLVDLSGFTAGNRLLVFARKSSPVQVTYLGSLTTTALSAIDYRLTDRFLTPAVTQEWFSEELIRLPGCFACYRPPADAPAVAMLPMDTCGYATFGSFNNLKKVTADVIVLWSRILQNVPGSRLVLKDATLADACQRSLFLKSFTDRGIDKERIELLPRTPMPTFLADYGRIDIGLDPFPYNGCTTTCEALWMGVPVVTLAGVMSYSRFGVSLLSNLGLDGLIATDPESYVAKAVELANDRNRLAALRSGLRQRMAASTICDSKAFARVVESAYRMMWKRWCQST